MGKLFKNTFLFLILASIIYCIWIIIFAKLFEDKTNKNMYLNNYRSHNFSTNKDLLDKKDVSILFLGSSKSYRGFDPRIFLDFGYENTINLGTSAQTPIQTYILLNKYLNQLNPEFVVFEVNPEIMSKDGVESSVEILSSYTIDVELSKLLFITPNIKVINAFLSNFIHQNIISLEKFIPFSSESYVFDGYVTSNDFMKDTSIYKINQKPINQKQLNYLVKIVNLLNKKKINFILLQSPIRFNEYYQYNNVSFDIIINNITTKYLNLNKLFPINKSHYFYDYFHLNQNGVDTFNTYFIKNHLINLYVQKNTP